MAKVSELVKSSELAGGLVASKGGNRLSKAERFALAMADKYEPAAPANWASAPDSVVEAIDAIAAAYPVGSAGAAGSAKTVSALYDFSINGGAIGTIGLGVSLPAKAIVLEVIQDTLVAPVGVGATAILRIGATGTLSDANIVGDSLGAAAVSPVSTLPHKSSAGGELGVVVTAAALTAGKVRWFIRYVISE